MNCKVCQNSKASSHSYYGATSICPSCRGFFMRSVQSQIYQTFQDCPLNSGCVIESKSRKSCKSCRFQKCLSAGMKINYVMTFEEKRQMLISVKTKLHKPLELTFQEANKQEALTIWNKFRFIGSSGIYECYVNNIQHALRHFDLQHSRTYYDNNQNEQFDDYLDFELMRRFVVDFFISNGQGSVDANKLFKHNFYRMKTLYHAVFCFGVSRYILHLKMTQIVYLDFFLFSEQLLH